jgi:hypothetical protein
VADKIYLENRFPDSPFILNEKLDIRNSQIIREITAVSDFLVLPHPLSTVAGIMPV